MTDVDQEGPRRTSSTRPGRVGDRLTDRLLPDGAEDDVVLVAVRVRPQDR
ncbi:hypothetical protein [Blastococcus capsensis]|nr:hypothetical protein [Blastococcus capsensis]MDK3258279.1 hypothetical protein [Blastococcus capsensis]